MSTPVIHILILGTLALSTSMVAAAHTSSTLPCGLDSGAVFLDTNTITVELSTSSTFRQSLAPNDNVQIQESTWGSSTGRITHVLDPTTLAATGGGIDHLTFAQIIDILALEAVRTGVDSGFSGCGDTVSVLTSTCVARTGTGSSTQFIPCGPDCCERTYLTTCPDSLTAIPVPLTEASATCAPVGGGCESGCDGAGGSAGLTLHEPQRTERSR